MVIVTVMVIVMELQIGQIGQIVKCHRPHHLLRVCLVL